MNVLSQNTFKMHTIVVATHLIISLHYTSCVVCNLIRMQQ